MRTERRRSKMKEPSTYAGIAALGALFAHYFDPLHVQQVIQAISGLAGIAAIFIPENKQPPAP